MPGSEWPLVDVQAAFPWATACAGGVILGKHPTLAHACRLGQQTGIDLLG